MQCNTIFQGAHAARIRLDIRHCEEANSQLNLVGELVGKPNRWIEIVDFRLAPGFFGLEGKPSGFVAVQVAFDRILKI